jgi:hypothetical protein
MNRLIIRSRVDADGMLRLNVPVGAADADREMQVTVEPIASTVEERAKYAAWLESIAGKWQGDFERMPQGDFEERDPL